MTVSIYLAEPRRTRMARPEPLVGGPGRQALDHRPAPAHGTAMWQGVAGGRRRGHALKIWKLHSSISKLGTHMTAVAYGAAPIIVAGIAAYVRTCGEALAL